MNEGEQREETIKVGDVEHKIVVRDMTFPESAAAWNKATTVYPTGDRRTDMDVYILERLKARVLLIDGNPPDWEKLDEDTGWALAMQYGHPPKSILELKKN